MKAKNRFCLMFRIVARLNRRARRMPRRSPLTRVTPALSMATSVPVPMAIPTWACASAGASLIPSPAMATMLPSPCRRFTASAFWSGRTSATTSSSPSLPATAIVPAGSPIHTMSFPEASAAARKKGTTDRRRSLSSMERIASPSETASFRMFIAQPPPLRSIAGEVILPGCDVALLDHQVLAFHLARQWLGVAPPLDFLDPHRGDRHLAFVAHHPVFLLAIPVIRPEAAVARVEGGPVHPVRTLYRKVVDLPSLQVRLEKERLTGIKGRKGNPYVIRRFDHARSPRVVHGGLLEDTADPSRRTDRGCPQEEDHCYKKEAVPFPASEADSAAYSLRGLMRCLVSSCGIRHVLALRVDISTVGMHFPCYLTRKSNILIISMKCTGELTERMFPGGRLPEEYSSRLGSIRFSATGGGRAKRRVRGNEGA